MPVQTSKKANIYFPDGAKVEVQEMPGGDWFDVGAINSAVTNTLNWTESSVETANAGKLNTKISDMEMAGGFTLVNLDPEGIQKMGGGVFKVTKLDGTPVTPKMQEIPAFKEKVLYPLTVIDNATGVSCRTQVAPTFTTVQGSAGSSPISEGSGYVVMKDDNAPSGWGIVVLDKGGNSGALQLTYEQVTPVKATTIHCGSSSVVLQPYGMRITHTDDAGKKRILELPCVYSNSGGFQFNFKGANEDGIEEMPLTYTARLDTSRLNGQQLMSWSIDNGAA